MPGQVRWSLNSCHWASCSASVDLQYGLGTARWIDLLRRPDADIAPADLQAEVMALQNAERRRMATAATEAQLLCVLSSAHVSG